MKSETSAGPTRARILDVAERLAQMRGFNGFSYADIASELGVTKATLHYHFAGKAELGEALIRRYNDRFGEALAAIAGSADPAPALLASYAELYADVLRGSRMCLCGMLAAEFETLPDSMRAAVTGFFDENELWLTRVLDQGRRDGTLAFTGAAADVARAIIDGLEGAMLVAHAYHDVTRFEASATRLLEGLAK